MFAALGERVIHAGPTGAGHAGAALGDFLRAVHILASGEALRFGLDIAEALAGVGPR